MFRAYDAVTLAIVGPTLLGASLVDGRGSFRARLVCASMLAYTVYTSAFYVFGAQFNRLFLVHVIVFSGSIFALIVTLQRLDVADAATRFRERTPVRFLSAILGILAGSLGAMWILSSLRFALSGEVPVEASHLILPTPITHLGYVMDLAFLVPGYALAAILLWRRSGLGYVLATVLVISGALHQVSYMTALVFQAREGVPGARGFDPAEPFILAAYTCAAALLLFNVRRSVLRQNTGWGSVYFSDGADRSDAYVDSAQKGDTR
jgi:hypothetical protein